MAVVIVDLGHGNLHSVAGAFARLGVATQVTHEAEVVRSADRLVLPGQGGFAAGAQALAGELGEAVRHAIARGAPYLGICLGMQLLFEGSEEAPGAAGLGLLPGQVRRFAQPLVDAATGASLKVPHMGWNQVQSRCALVPDGAWFYFVHSYVCQPADASQVAVTATHGEAFCAAVAQGSLFACQFHPEKSHDAGEQLLQRWLRQ